jgi:lysophospholipase L1-like esterase
VRDKKTILKNLSLVLVSILITSVLIEIGLRIFYPQPTKYFYFKKNSEPGDCFERWGVEVKINSNGHRDYEYPITRAKEVYRIALIGDSIEYGTGVRIEDTYGKKLETMLNRFSKGQKRFQVIIFSNGGTEPSGYLEMLKTDAYRFKPDLIIIGFTLNDFERTRVKKTLRQRYYQVFAKVHQKMRVISHLYFFVFERLRNTLYETGILDRSVRHGFWMDILETRGDIFKGAWEYTRQNLDELIKDSKKIGAGFAIVVFPYEMQLSEELLEIYRSTYGFRISKDILDAKPQKLLCEYAESRNITLINLLEPFRNHWKKKLYFREIGGSLDYVHPNTKGHAIAAKIIYNELLDREIIPLDLLKSVH